MLRYRRRQVSMNPKAGWLFGFALLLKLLVPAGYMVDPVRAAGAWPIVLCPDGLPAGAATLTPRRAGTGGSHHAVHTEGRGHGVHGIHASGSPDGGQAAQAGGDCAFSGFAPALGTTAPAAASPLGFAAPPPAFAAFGIGRGLAAPPPPATGPPAL